MDDSLTARLADRLRRLRQERGWPLERLAEASGVSRATLSRLENAEVSPTTEVLGRLCAAYGLSLTRLLAQVEEGFAPVVRRAAQAVWRDPAAGFVRRSVSPPALALAAEVIECSLEPGADLAYPTPPVPGQEHHLCLLDGRLRVAVDGEDHALEAGDCLRYRLFGPSRFATPADAGARYIVVLVGG